MQIVNKSIKHNVGHFLDSQVCKSLFWLVKNKTDRKTKKKKCGIVFKNGYHPIAKKRNQFQYSLKNIEICQLFFPRLSLVS